MAAGMIPLMIVYFFLQKYYRRSYVELQRCDATSRSPVYAHFSESLTGVETIRAFRYQERFASKSDSQIDYNHRYMQQSLRSAGACAACPAAGSAPSVIGNAPFEGLFILVNCYQFCFTVESKWLIWYL